MHIHTTHISLVVYLANLTVLLIDEGCRWSELEMMASKGNAAAEQMQS